MNISSKLWQVIGSLNGIDVYIVQRASGASRVLPRNKLPSVEALAAMSEERFDSLMRDAFHAAAAL